MFKNFKASEMLIVSEQIEELGVEVVAKPIKRKKAAVS